MTSNPSGTVTFLFTDIENSTKLAREYPEFWETAQLTGICRKYRFFMKCTTCYRPVINQFRRNRAKCKSYLGLLEGGMSA